MTNKQNSASKLEVHGYPHQRVTGHFFPFLMLPLLEVLKISILPCA